MPTKPPALLAHGVAGWAICGATVIVGRQILAMQATLVIHAIVAPLAFGLLTWHYFKRFPDSSPVRTALTLLGLVAGLDGLLVAPVFERSYAMFRSILGTWAPFGSIFAASYIVGRRARARTLENAQCPT